jgi:hypothetical protein
VQCYPRHHSKERDKENNPPKGNDVGIESEVFGGEMFDREYEGGPKSSRSNNGKKNIISKLFLFFNIISLKTNTFIPAMLQRHYLVPVVVLRKICKIALYSCNRLLIRRKMLTSEEEF